MQKEQILEISFWTMLKAAMLVILLWLVWIIRDIVAVMCISIVIASAIEPVNHFLAKYRIPRVLSVLFIYLSAFFVISLIFYLIVPTLLGDMLDFTASLPLYIESTLGPSGPLFLALPQLPSTITDLLRNIALSLEKSIPALTSGVFSAGSSLFGGVLSFILLIVISFYLSVQEHGIENFLRIVTPLEHEAYILDLWKRSQRKIGRWFQGQILLGVLVGVIVFLGLTIIEVKYALLLSILAMIFEVIPVFGPIMAAIPSIAIAFVQSPALGLKVLILYIVVQQFENHLIYPLVVRKTVGVPPLLVVLSLVIGGSLGGFYGIVLAVPAAAVLVEFLNDISLKRYKAK